MRVRAGLAGAALCAVLAACATPPRPAAPPPARPFPPRPAPSAPQPPAKPARPVSWAAVPGWPGEDHLAALAAVDAACHVGSALARPCADLRRYRPSTDAEAREFFEAGFEPVAIPGEGLLTAYFSPVYQARTAPGEAFTAPVRPPSPEAARLDRAAIEDLPPDNALAWMRPEDLFFLQIQGSGVLVLEDGRRRKASVAATNGLPFVPIARPMREQGLLAASNTSGDAIRAWLADHRGPEAQAVMRLNPRYVFFALRPDDGREPAGAAGVPLPAGRALAVDPTRHAMGELFFIDATAPTLNGAFPAYRRVAAALDIGGAIKGEVRADLYIGRGDDAGREAGRVRHTLRLFRLVPRQ